MKSDDDVETCDFTLPIQLNNIVTNIDIVIDKNNPICITTQGYRHYLSKYVPSKILLSCLKACSIQFTPP
ncbi:unnamed protein product [Rotaria sp. Silwood2]|nr:unnamed protein product [Rotaria sp. Silwood2]